MDRIRTQGETRGVAIASPTTVNPAPHFRHREVCPAEASGNRRLLPQEQTTRMAMLQTYQTEAGLANVQKS